MSGTVSMWARDAIVRQIFRQESIITDCWVALTQTVPESNAVGSNLSEPVGLGYARINVPLGTVNWGLTGYSEVYNLLEVTFPNPTSDWGLIQGWALLNASTGGETIAVGNVVNPQRVLFGKPPTIKVGGIVFGLWD